MQHYRTLTDLQLSGTWLTIGSFDGVHRGHQAIIRQIVEGAHASRGKAVVLTFHPHPSVVLGKRKQAFYLTTPDLRAELLGEMGVDVVITLPFTTELAQRTPQDFMSELHTHLGLVQLWVGHDFALGRNRAGTPQVLAQIGAELGYGVQEIDPIQIDGQLISSSEIRSLLFEGDVIQAARLLGRPYRLQGEVVPGDGRGRTIGFPTANLNVWEQLAVPKAGVYVCKAGVGCEEGQYGAVTNIGVRPTFDLEDPPRTIETHLLDFSYSLYGKIVQLDFLQRLRDEQRFPSVEALVAQINHDVASSRTILSQ